jgi:hypothetical protein
MSKFSNYLFESFLAKPANKNAYLPLAEVPRLAIQNKKLTVVQSIAAENLLFVMLIWIFLKHFVWILPRM